jgi:hypothetical protein
MREKVKEVSMRLREKLFPFFLRRDKPSVQMASTAVRTADVRMMAWVAAGCTGAFHADSDKYDTITVPSTRGDGKSLEGIRKNEFVLWMPLSPVQRIVYRAALESDTLKVCFTLDITFPTAASALSTCTITQTSPFSHNDSVFL